MVGNTYIMQTLQTRSDFGQEPEGFVSCLLQLEEQVINSPARRLAIPNIDKQGWLEIYSDYVMSAQTFVTTMRGL